MRKNVRGTFIENDPMESFMEKVSKRDDGCWYWTGAIKKNGYGAFSNQRLGFRNGITAHRASYHIFKGNPGELFVLHKCDVKKCVNPEHLFLGTSLDNNRDCIAKGRARWVNPPIRKGEKNNKAKLTEKKVREIRILRSIGMRLEDIAILQFVSAQAIHAIVSGKTWRHVV